jgi:TP901 family phage tail tape measure protein
MSFPGGNEGDRYVTEFGGDSTGIEAAGKRHQQVIRDSASAERALQREMERTARSIDQLTRKTLDNGAAFDVTKGKYAQANQDSRNRYVALKEEEAVLLRKAQAEKTAASASASASAEQSRAAQAAAAKKKATLDEVSAWERKAASESARSAKAQFSAWESAYSAVEKAAAKAAREQEAASNRAALAAERAAAKEAAAAEASALRTVKARERAVEKLPERLKRSGEALAFTESLAVGVGAYEGAKEAGGTQRALLDFGAGSDLSAKQMAQVGDAARKLGGDLKIPGDTAAEAVGQIRALVQAGQSLPAALQEARSAALLAADADMDHGQAASFLGQVLRDYKLPASEAANVTDMLVAAHVRAKVPIESLQAGIAKASDQFSKNHQPLSELITDISLLERHGVDGAKAGQQLEQSMIKLGNPSTKAQQILKELGVTVYDLNTGQMKPFHQVLGEVSEKLAGYDDASKNAALSTIFGAKSQQAANLLIADGARGWENMRAKVEEHGAAARFAASQLEGLTGAENQLHKASFALADEWGRSWLPTETAIIQKTADFVGWLGEASPATAKWTTAILGISAAVGPSLVAIGHLWIQYQNLSKVRETYDILTKQNQLSEEQDALAKQQNAAASTEAAAAVDKETASVAALNGALDANVAASGAAAGAMEATGAAAVTATGEMAAAGDAAGGAATKVGLLGSSLASMAGKVFTVGLVAYVSYKATEWLFPTDRIGKENDRANAENRDESGGMFPQYKVDPKTGKYTMLFTPAERAANRQEAVADSEGRARADNDLQYDAGERARRYSSKGGPIPPGNMEDVLIREEAAAQVAAEKHAKAVEDAKNRLQHGSWVDPAKGGAERSGAYKTILAIGADEGFFPGKTSDPNGATFGGKHVSPAHPQGRAVDFSMQHHTAEEVDAFLEDMRKRGFKVIKETSKATGGPDYSAPNIHVEIAAGKSISGAGQVYDKYHPGIAAQEQADQHLKDLMNRNTRLKEGDTSAARTEDKIALEAEALAREHVQKSTIAQIVAYERENAALETQNSKRKAHTKALEEDSKWLAGLEAKALAAERKASGANEAPGMGRMDEIALQHYGLHFEQLTGYKRDQVNNALKDENRADAANSIAKANKEAADAVDRSAKSMEHAWDSFYNDLNAATKRFSALKAEGNKFFGDLAAKYETEKPVTPADEARKSKNDATRSIDDWVSTHPDYPVDQTQIDSIESAAYNKPGADFAAEKLKNLQDEEKALRANIAAYGDEKKAAREALIVELDRPGVTDAIRNQILAEQALNDKLKSRVAQMEAIGGAVKDALKAGVDAAMNPPHRDNSALRDEKQHSLDDLAALDKAYAADIHDAQTKAAFEHDRKQIKGHLHDVEDAMHKGGRNAAQRFLEGFTESIDKAAQKMEKDAIDKFIDNTVNKWMQRLTGSISDAASGAGKQGGKHDSAGAAATDAAGKIFKLPGSKDGKNEAVNTLTANELIVNNMSSPSALGNGFANGGGNFWGTIGSIAAGYGGGGGGEASGGTGDLPPVGHSWGGYPDPSKPFRIHSNEALVHPSGMRFHVLNPMETERSQSTTQVVKEGDTHFWTVTPEAAEALAGREKVVMRKGSEAAAKQRKHKVKSAI